MSIPSTARAVRTPSRGPALRLDHSAVARSFAGSSDTANQLARDLTGRSKSARDVADQGTKANAALGSHAYAMGNDVAFKSASPSPGLVAHELTHVVQRSNGPAASGSSADGIDRSGEAQATAVENAVNAGKPASSVLGNSSGVAGARAGAEDEPALAADSFGMGWTFSAEAFERSYEYTIWKTPAFLSPTPVPGLFWKIQPNVKVVGKGGVGYGGQKKGDLSVSLRPSSRKRPRGGPWSAA